MRASLIAIICATALVPSAASAEQRATRSVDDYLCAFAGKCGSAPAVTQGDDSKAAPDTKGFRLVRATSATPTATTAAPATKGFRLMRASGSSGMSAPVPVAAKPVARTHLAAINPRHRVARSSAIARPAATAEQRADLRLSFDNGSANLTDQARAEAKVFAESLQRPELASKHFLIEGHTDSVGGRAYNKDLSDRRAAAVAAYLASLGVDRQRIATKGLAFDRPLAGHSPASPDNRRVEALLIN